MNQQVVSILAAAQIAKIRLYCQIGTAKRDVSLSRASAARLFDRAGGQTGGSMTIFFYTSWHDACFYNVRATAPSLERPAQGARKTDGWRP